MSATDILIIIGFFFAFACVRFGVPICVCWLISQAHHRFMHPEA